MYCLLTLLEEERALKTELELVQKEIVDNLYIIDEGTNKDVVDEAKARHGQLRSRESELRSLIRKNKNAIGGYILKLFGDQLV